MKAILPLLLMLPALALHAQAPELVTLRDTDGTVVNGATITVQGTPQDVELEAVVVAELNGTTTRTINLLRRESSLVQGSQNHLFWNVNMYPPLASGAFPTWVSPDPLPMAPQDTAVLNAIYRPNGTVGTCCFRHVWYDVGSPSDSSWVIICFDTQTLAGMPDPAAIGPSLNAYPNPVVGGADVAMEYQLTEGGSARVVIYSSLGASAFVRSTTGFVGRTVLPTSTLAPGVWFAALEQDGRVVATHRFVVTRQP